MKTILGIIIFCMGVYAIASIVSTKEDTMKKVLWILIVLIFPIIGFIIWWFAGPKGKIGSM